jgi:hypothetical protein
MLPDAVYLDVFYLAVAIGFLVMCWYFVKALDVL